MKFHTQFLVKFLYINAEKSDLIEKDPYNWWRRCAVLIHWFVKLVRKNVTITWQQSHGSHIIYTYTLYRYIYIMNISFKELARVLRNTIHYTIQCRYLMFLLKYYNNSVSKRIKLLLKKKKNWWLFVWYYELSDGLWLVGCVGYFKNNWNRCLYNLI